MPALIHIQNGRARDGRNRISSYGVCVLAILGMLWMAKAQFEVAKTGYFWLVFFAVAVVTGGGFVILTLSR